MRLARAEQIARSLIEEMSPYCGRCEIAGSVRRRKEEVKDIEIVATPMIETEYVQEGLFTEPVETNLLYKWAAKRSGIHWIKPGVSQIVPWSIKPDGKYWRGLLPQGIKLDLFIADHTNFGLIYVIRTGCAEFTTALVTYAKRVGIPSVDGRLIRDGQPVETPDEHTVFSILGLEYVEPEQRTSYTALRVRKL
jgi:DNA polymerase/3'-5' exonuclease PolX